MTISRNFVRWCVLCAAIIWGLLQLNAGLAIGWLGTDPGWLFIAGNRLAWAAASFLAGASLFVLMGHNRSAHWYAISALIAAILLTAYPYVREFIASDMCLDSGGKWLDLHCIYQAPPAA